MITEDTIVALATPPGEGGIAVIRLSGPESLQIASRLYTNGKREKQEQFKDRYLQYGYILDKEQNIVDEVLMVSMKAPKTYTREDVVEIHCHGGMIPVQKIIDLTLEEGARLAQPGEFTKRAFLNGRVDLTQAEAVMDLISSKSEDAARASLSQMEGSLSRKIKTLRDDLLDLMARIEVTVDYPEEDIEEMLRAPIGERLAKASSDCLHLLETAHQGRLVREGLKVVIIGKPNVGKSSLLNALVRENRAIVTDIPGTTRDVIEDYINIKGVLVRILDTAGIRETMDQVEKIGVEKAHEAIRSADLILFVLDGWTGFEKEDEHILENVKDFAHKTLYIVNKTDQTDEEKLEQIRNIIPEVIEISVLEDSGINVLEQEIQHFVNHNEIDTDNQVLVTNARHKQLLLSTLVGLKAAGELIKEKMTLDIIAMELKAAAENLGRITGHAVSEEIVINIFERFCIGK